MPIPFYLRKTPTLETPGEKSFDLDTELGTGDYGADSDHVEVKAIWCGAAGIIKGFKLRDDTTGTPREWTVPAGGYLLGPFALIKSTANGTTATKLIAEHF